MALGEARSGPCVGWCARDRARSRRTGLCRREPPGGRVVRRRAVPPPPRHSCLPLSLPGDGRGDGGDGARLASAGRRGTRRRRRRGARGRVRRAARREPPAQGRLFTGRAADRPMASAVVARPARPPAAPLRIQWARAAAPLSARPGHPDTADLGGGNGADGAPTDDSQSIQVSAYGAGLRKRDRPTVTDAAVAGVPVLRRSTRGCRLYDRLYYDRLKSTQLIR